MEELILFQPSPLCKCRAGRVPALEGHFQLCFSSSREHFQLSLEVL